MSKITETKLKQIIKEELDLLKKEKEIERNKDQFAHKFSSVFVEALELDTETEVGKNTLNEVYSFLTRYTLNEVLDNWVTYPVSADGSIMYSNPINALPGATPEGVGAGGLIKLFKAGPNDKNVTYAVTVNTGKLNTLGADKVKTEIARLLKTASDKSIDQAQDNTNEIGDPFADESLANNAGPLKGLGESVEYPEDLKSIPVNMILKYIENASTLVPGSRGNSVLELETFARYMALMATDLIKTDREGYSRVSKAASDLRQRVRDHQIKLDGPRTTLTYKRNIPVTESLTENILNENADLLQARKLGLISPNIASQYTQVRGYKDKTHGPYTIVTADHNVCTFKTNKGKQFEMVIWWVSPQDYGYSDGLPMPNTDKRIYGEW